MEGKQDLLKVIEDKKKRLNNSTNDLLGLYRKLLEERIDYKKDKKYEEPISKQRKMINELESEVTNLEIQLKESKIKNIETKIKKYKKDK